MPQDNEHRTLVQDYFKRIAPRYGASFYKGERGLHNVRMDLALENCELEGKSVLDIGAGTGELYNRIADSGIRSYHAIEPNAAMASRSRIPDENVFCSSFENFKSDEKFDLIYALGVHSYLDDELESRFWEFITEHLSDSGKAVVSFTNSRCFVNHLRVSARTVVSHFRPWPQYPVVRATSYDTLKMRDLPLTKAVYFHPVFSFLSSHSRHQRRAFLYTDFLGWFS